MFSLRNICSKHWARAPGWSRGSENEEREILEGVEKGVLLWPEGPDCGFLNTLSQLKKKRRRWAGPQLPGLKSFCVLKFWHSRQFCHW